MIRNLSIALVFLWLPFASNAQQTKVRSGEHSGYSRLVAPLTDNRDWKVTHIGQDVIFAVAGYDQGYDLSTVFTYIPRDRVQSITSRPDGFTIRLGCACRVAPFVDKERFVVIDIASPGVTLASTFIPMKPKDLPKPKQESQQEIGIKPVEPNIAVPMASMPRNDPIQPAALPALARAPLSELEQDSLTEISRRLTRELGTATTRGLLTPVPGPSLPISRRAQVDLSAIAEPEAPPPVPKPENLSGVLNNMRVSSSMDIPGFAKATDDPQSLSGLNCPLNATLDIANWGDDRPFHQQTGDLRRSLYQEFDKLDQEAALNLAKLYLHFGFGAEARQILRLDTDLASSQGILADIASILETGTARQGSRLPLMLDCNTDVALWAMLANADLGTSRAIDPRSALLALNKLPVHLRDVLAPVLSQRLLAHGDSDAAASALRSVQRLPSELSSSAKLAQAHIALDSGNMNKASEDLSDVIDDNAEHSPEALISLVDARIVAQQPISAETASLVEAYAKELNQTELGPALRRTHVLALVRSGQFDAAFAASKELGGDSEEDDAVKLRMRLIQELVAAAEDVVFLEYIFRQSPQDITRLPARQKLALATRLLDLGFAKQAQTILPDHLDYAKSESYQIIAARIALDMSQPMRAQAALLGVTGQDADLLRAKATQMTGAHAEAHDLFLLANDDDAAARAAWLAEDESNQRLAENAVFGPALALSNADIPATRQTDGMLARSEAALSESRAARETLLNLLQAPELLVGSEGITP